ADVELAPLVRQVLMPAGGRLVFAGALLPRGGANPSPRARAAFSHPYCQPGARAQGNFLPRGPVQVARRRPSPLPGRLGYSIHPPFMGQLSASHPRKALAEGYVLPLVEQARAAGARLPE